MIGLELLLPEPRRAFDGGGRDDAEKTEASHPPEVHLAEDLVAQIASVRRDVFGVPEPIWERPSGSGRLGSPALACPLFASPDPMYRLVCDILY
jgi:hypothetical protein